jgi:uncharacterized protein (TIGR02594 family)
MPAPIPMTPYNLALRFLALKEVPGHVHNPAIVAMCDLVDPRIRDDETPWCSAFVNYCNWLIGVDRSGSLSARSWLLVGAPVRIDEARPGFDVVILKRTANAPPAAELHAPGHVGFFSGYDPAKKTVSVLGGNQGDQVSIADFPLSRVLGIRRLA